MTAADLAKSKLDSLLHCIENIDVNLETEDVDEELLQSEADEVLEDSPRDSLEESLKDSLEGSQFGGEVDGALEQHLDGSLEDDFVDGTLEASSESSNQFSLKDRRKVQRGIMPDNPEQVVFSIYSRFSHFHLNEGK